MILQTAIFLQDLTRPEKYCNDIFIFPADFTSDFTVL